MASQTGLYAAGIQDNQHPYGWAIYISRPILERCKSVTLAGAIMFINRIRFINTTSRHVKFMTTEQIANPEASTLQESIRQVKQVYMQQGFKITNILTNGKFTCFRGNLVEV